MHRKLQLLARCDVREDSDVTRRFVVYFCSAAYTLKFFRAV